MSETEDSLHTLARFATVLASLSHEESLSTRLCEAGRLVLEADSAAITLEYAGQSRLSISVSDDLASAMEDIQDVVGEGPGFDAARSGAVVIGQLGDDEECWQLLSQRIDHLGFVGTVLAIPLYADDEAVVGVLTAYRRGPEHPADLHAARFLSVTIGTALLQHPDVTAREKGITEAWESRAQVHQATGMVVAQLGVRPEDALALLRGQAFARNISLLDVARDVVGRRINFKDFTIEGD